MTWVKIDDGFADRPEVAVVGAIGLGLHIAGLCYANRNLTDGFIPTSIARRLIDVDGWGSCRGEEYVPANIEAIIVALVDAGLWESRGPGGYQIRDYLKDQPSREQVLALREERSRAGRAGAKRRWQEPKQIDGKRHGKSQGKSMREGMAD